MRAKLTEFKRTERFADAFFTFGIAAYHTRLRGPTPLRQPTRMPTKAPKKATYDDVLAPRRTQRSPSLLRGFDPLANGLLGRAEKLARVAERESNLSGQSSRRLDV
jgi:hypothetical protein